MTGKTFLHTTVCKNFKPKGEKNFKVKGPNIIMGPNINFKVMLTLKFGFFIGATGLKNKVAPHAHDK